MSSTPQVTPLPYFKVEVIAGNSGKGDLYRAAHRGDWEATSSILLDKSLRVAELNGECDTVLHVAVGTGKAFHYLQKLVSLMHPEELGMVDRHGQTPLMVAAIIGNIKAAKLLVHKNLHLLYKADKKGLLPIHRAAQYGQKDVLLYLLKVTARDDPFPYVAVSGAKLLTHLMEAEFYDVATSLLISYPQLIDESFIGELSEMRSSAPLTMLAKNPSVFRRMGFWKCLLYNCIPKNWQISYECCSIGVMTPAEEYQLEQSNCPSTVVRYLTSFIRHIRPPKPIRDQAIQLVRCVCAHASISSLLNVKMFEEPFLLAAKNGIVEIVEELAETFPDLMWVKNDKAQNIFQIAVLGRHQSVYNLIYRVAKDKRYKTRDSDSKGNNILHMAGKLAPLDSLDMVSGAALKMRYELQWFEEVGKSVRPFQRGELNHKRQTPKEVFRKEHKRLVKEGEIWMKSTANSCTTPAALIATVVFAAAIAVPNSNKIGSLTGEAAFIVFAYADALSLFTALSSLLMFVSVLTSRYTEDEFLYALPLRIVTGLLTLLISISSMMVAFSMILYLTCGGGKTWIFSTVVTAACAPATLFVILHYSLLADMILYWKFPQISGKKGSGGGRPLYTRPRSVYTYRNNGY